MSYRLEAEENLSAGIQRIAREQVDQAIAVLTNSQVDPHEAIHDARKCFKKVRAVLRLVRDEIGPQVYKRENVDYRDAGRRLSKVRDSAVRIETLDELREHFADQLAPEAFAQARASLVKTHRAVSQRVLEQEKAPQEVVARLQTARARIPHWPIGRQDFSALYGGLRRVYKRGRNRLADAYAEPRPENFHEWRKRVKYLWYHVRILNPVWPSLFEELADEIHRLSDYLGDDHDLAELRYRARSHSEMFDESSERQALIAFIDRRRAELEATARPLGRRIYAEKPDDFVRRVETYWSAWQEMPKLKIQVGIVSSYVSS